MGNVPKRLQLLKSFPSGSGGSGGSGAQPDLNASEGEPGHVLNRTHWVDFKRVNILPIGSFALDEDAYCDINLNKPMVIGKSYVITINGVEYERKAVFDEGFECPYIGSQFIMDWNSPANEYNDEFYLADLGDGACMFFMDMSKYVSKTITLSVHELERVVHKLPAEYIPENIGVTSDLNAAKGEPGHVLNRTHYSEYVATLADNVSVTSGIICSWINYDLIKDYKEVTVIYDDTFYYECPITIVTSIDGDYFHIGNFQDSAPEYPFFIYGYLTNGVATVNVGEGTHTISVKLSEVVKKLDKKYLPDDIGGVLYTEQTLPEEQKAQARTNIGAVSMEEVEELLGIEEEFSVSGEVVEFDIDVEPDTKLQVVSKIHRDSTWGLSNKLVLHQVSGSNFVDLTSYLGGAGTVIEKNGLTATVNCDSTVTIRGTNDSSSSVQIIDVYNWSGEQVYPAGTYTIPSGFIMAIRAAQYPANVRIDGASGNLSYTVNIPEPFRIVWLNYYVRSGVTVDVTLPLGLFRGNTIPETGYEYNGQLHTVTFESPIYDGEFNWSTGELKDMDGNTVGYYDATEIKRLPGTNYFWTCWGENTVSNASDDLGKVIIRLDEPAPEETVPSICNFMLTPTTMEAAYSLFDYPVMPGGVFSGHEFPVLTTKGTLFVKDVDGNVKYSKYIDNIFNARGIADVLTHEGLEKKWSEKFYLNKDAVSTTTIPAPYDGAPVNYVFTWEFDENEFINSGIPAKLRDIPMTSPCFINNDSSEENINNSVVGNGGAFIAFFSYSDETGKYTLTVRGSGNNSAQALTTVYSKVHFYYQLETPCSLSFVFAMGIDAGDIISFEADAEDAQPYIDERVYRMTSGRVTEAAVDPSVTVFIPRSVEDAMDGMSNVARILNTSDSAAGGDATVQGYSWIGEGDGVTDYAAQIQAKLDELHTVSNGGTIHLGPGTYPISKSLIVYKNTQIIGDGRTIIEQRSDNTHAVVWSGSNIRMCDLTITLAGECIESTACIFVNSNNISDNRDERYPENTYVQYCSTRNVTLTGTYSISWEDGYAYLSDRDMAYRGVGICSHDLFFNYFDCDGLTCKHLYAGVYDGGGANNYRIYVTESRFAVYGGGGNNIFDIHGHAYYSLYGRDGIIYGTEYVYYSEFGHANTITVGFYDIQYSRGLLYFDGKSQMNRYSIPSSVTGVFTSNGSYGGFRRVVDYGRGNTEVQPIRENYVGVGSILRCISGLAYWNTQFNPSIHNALSGAGIWGSVTSNKEWTSNGLNLLDICRYPQESVKVTSGLASVVCNSSPSEESPVEITIDISDRPVANYDGFWIQFDHRYVAEDYTVSFDTTNDGTFDHIAVTVAGNDQPVSCRLDYQANPHMVYRIKISITKALQIPDFLYNDAGYNEYVINYNPDGLIGIVNIGIPSNEAYGRAFLGECGGSLYGNVDMHQNTLKNLPNPVDDGDAVSKSYLEERLAALEALINGT